MKKAGKKNPSALLEGLRKKGFLRVVEPPPPETSEFFTRETRFLPLFNEEDVRKAEAQAKNGVVKIPIRARTPGSDEEENWLVIEARREYAQKIVAKYTWRKRKPPPKPTSANKAQAVQWRKKPVPGRPGDCTYEPDDEVMRLRKRDAIDVLAAFTPLVYYIQSGQMHTAIKYAMLFSEAFARLILRTHEPNAVRGRKHGVGSLKGAAATNAARKPKPHPKKEAALADYDRLRKGDDPRSAASTAGKNHTVHAASVRFWVRERAKEKRVQR